MCKWHVNVPHAVGQELFDGFVDPGANSSGGPPMHQEDSWLRPDEFRPDKATNSDNVTPQVYLVISSYSQGACSCRTTRNVRCFSAADGAATAHAPPVKSKCRRETLWRRQLIERHRGTVTISGRTAHFGLCTPAIKKLVLRINVHHQKAIH